MTPSTQREERAREIEDRYKHAMTLRGTLDQQCEEIARRILPNYAGSFTNKEGYKLQVSPAPKRCMMPRGRSRSPDSRRRWNRC